MRRTLLAAILALAAGCRPDPGLPDYSMMDNLFDGGPESQGLPGPDPYVTGGHRLALDLFYEGGASLRLSLADPSRHYYIYSNTYTDVLTSDRIEGLYANLFTIPSTTPGWWGGGITYDTAVNLSAWTTMHVSLKSQSPGMSDLDIRMATNLAAQVAVRATAYGYANDGQWHHLSIPLSRFTGVNLTTVLLPFGFGNPTSVTVHAGDSLIVDNLYFD
jgi:hypothetical protein